MKFQGFGGGGGGKTGEAFGGWGGDQRRSFSEVGRVFDLIFILVF